MDNYFPRRPFGTYDHNNTTLLKANLKPVLNETLPTDLECLVRKLDEVCQQAKAAEVKTIES
jgi:hypothetical protein